MFETELTQEEIGVILIVIGAVLGLVITGIGFLHLAGF